MPEFSVKDSTSRNNFCHLLGRLNISIRRCWVVATPEPVHLEPPFDLLHFFITVVTVASDLERLVASSYSELLVALSSPASWYRPSPPLGAWFLVFLVPSGLHAS